LYFFVFCFLISLFSKNFVLRTAIFEEIIFFFFLTKILHFMLQFLRKLFRCYRSEPLSDKRRSRAGDPRCIELALLTMLSNHMQSMRNRHLSPVTCHLQRRVTRPRHALSGHEARRITAFCGCRKCCRVAKCG